MSVLLFDRGFHAHVKTTYMRFTFKKHSLSGAWNYSYNQQKNESAMTPYKVKIKKKEKEKRRKKKKNTCNPH